MRLQNDDRIQLWSQLSRLRGGVAAAGATGDQEVHSSYDASIYSYPP